MKNSSLIKIAPIILIFTIITFASTLPNFSKLAGSITGILSGVILSMVVTKQSNYETERRSLIQKINEFSTLKRQQELQISIENYIFYLEDSGLNITKEKVLNIILFTNLSNPLEIEVLVRFLKQLRPSFREQFTSILKL